MNFVLMVILVDFVYLLVSIFLLLVGCMCMDNYSHHVAILAFVCLCLKIN